MKNDWRHTNPVKSIHQGLCFLTFLLVMVAQPVRAQETGADTQPEPQTPAVIDPQAKPVAKQYSPTGQFLRDVWIDQKAIWTAPVRMKCRQILTIALPLTAATVALIATDEKAGKWLPNTPNQIRWSGRVSTMGAVYSLGGIVGTGMIVGKAAKKPTLLEMGRLSAEAFANVVIVGGAVKGLTRRERPDQNTGQGRFWKGGTSFPSGHAMNAWAVATAVARNTKCPRILAYFSYGAATAVSLSRWGAHRHFPSDIMVGSVFGALIGNYVATRPR
jgi:membrane-associated phospholipid phosphatase